MRPPIAFAFGVAVAIAFGLPRASGAFSSIDIDQDLFIFEAYRGSIGPVDLITLKIPKKLTVQLLVDGQKTIWAGRKTEVLREVNVFRKKGTRLGVWIYSIDFLSGPSERFYLFKGNLWREVGMDKFDDKIFFMALRSSAGAIVCYGAILAQVVLLIYLYIYPSMCLRRLTGLPFITISCIYRIY